MTGQARIGQSFRRGLASYGGAARVQADVARDLAADIARLAPPNGFARALEFGCGTGFLTREMLARLRVGHWHINDLVDESRDHVAQLFDPQATWDFLPGAIETLDLPAALDLVASASTLQWVTDTRGLLARLGACLAPGGWLALASYAPRHFHELAPYGVAARAMSYHDSQTLASLLPEGLALHSTEEEERVVRFASPRAMLQHLRRTGVNGGTRGRWSRGDLAAFEAGYAAHHPDGAGGVTLTYAPIRLLAQKRMI